MNRSVIPPQQKKLRALPEKSGKNSGNELVQWTATASAAHIAPKGFFGIRVQAEIAPGYHVYSVTQAPGGPMPTSISLAAGQPFSRPWSGTSCWPKPFNIFSSQFGMEIEYHVGKVAFDFSLVAVADAAPGAHEVLIEIHYQLCHEHTCLVPESRQLRVPVEVIASQAAAGKQSAEMNAIQKAVAKQSSQTAIIERLKPILANTDKKKREEELWQLAADYPGSEIPYNLLAKPFLARAEFGRAAAIFRKGLAKNTDKDGFHALLLSCSANPGVNLRAKQAFVRRFPRSDKTPNYLQEISKELPSRSARLKLLRRLETFEKGDQGLLFPLFELAWELALEDLAGAAKQIASWLKAAVKRSAKGASLPFVFRDMAAARTAFFLTLAKCDRLLKRGKAKAAAAAAEKISAPEIAHFGVDDHDRVLLALMQAKTLTAAGEPQRAYDGLISNDRLLMSDEMLAAAWKLGTKLGRSKRQVEADAWERRLSADCDAAEFEVPEARGLTIQANDYRAHPLLVNVWNPG
jgi:hypothetical protein